MVVSRLNLLMDKKGVGVARTSTLRQAQGIAKLSDHRRHRLKFPNFNYGYSLFTFYLFKTLLH